LNIIENELNEKIKLSKEKIQKVETNKPNKIYNSKSLENDKPNIKLCLTKLKDNTKIYSVSNRMNKDSYSSSDCIEQVTNNSDDKHNSANKSTTNNVSNNTYQNSNKVIE
jgi:hypothetical protein